MTGFTGYGRVTAETLPLTLTLTPQQWPQSRRLPLQVRDDGFCRLSRRAHGGRPHRHGGRHHGGPAHGQVRHRFRVRISTCRVVHMVGGLPSLVGAIMVSPRMGR